MTLSNRSNASMATRKSIRLRVLAVKPARVGYFWTASFTILFVLSLSLLALQSSCRAPQTHRRLPTRRVKRKQNDHAYDMRGWKEYAICTKEDETRLQEIAEAFHAVSIAEILDLTTSRASFQIFQMSMRTQQPSLKSTKRKGTLSPSLQLFVKTTSSNTMISPKPEN